MLLGRMGKLLGYIAYCLVIGWIGYLGLDYWAAGVLEKRIQNGLPLYEGILMHDGDVLRTRRNFEGHWTASDFDISIRTNARGYREDRNFEDADVDVAFMGDSFTFGQGVNVEERYSNKAAAMLPGQTVVSLSYNNGFQPEHYEYFLQQHPALKPKVLFVGLYLGNDLDSDLKETLIDRDAAGNITRLQIPYRTAYKGVLVNAPNYIFDWLSTFVRETNIGKLVGMRINASSTWRKRLMKVLPHSDNTLAVENGELDSTNYRAIFALKRISEIVRARGGVTHVLLIPQNFLVGDVKHPHMSRKLRDRATEIRERGGLRKTILNACAADNLSCHDLALQLTPQDYLPDDGHWNAEGHAKAGNYAAELVKKNMGKNKMAYQERVSAVDKNH
jgi:hypothetical protein